MIAEQPPAVAAETHRQTAVAALERAERMIADRSWPNASTEVLAAMIAAGSALTAIFDAANDEDKNR